MSDDFLRVVDLCLRVITLVVASFGAWKIWQELRILNRRRPLLQPIPQASLDGGGVELLNVTGKPVVITDHSFRIRKQGGEEGITPYFTALERGVKLPVKLEDGESFTVAEGVQEGEIFEISLNCFLGGRAFQWAANAEGKLSARNTYVEISKPTLTSLPTDF